VTLGTAANFFAETLSTMTADTRPIAFFVRKKAFFTMPSSIVLENALVLGLSARADERTSCRQLDRTIIFHT
jgi:hypothetical protein